LEPWRYNKPNIPMHWGIYTKCVKNHHMNVMPYTELRSRTSCAENWQRRAWL